MTVEELKASLDEQFKDLFASNKAK
jgi:hypothetical protein